MPSGVWKGAKIHDESIGSEPGSVPNYSVFSPSAGSPTRRFGGSYTIRAFRM